MTQLARAKLPWECGYDALFWLDIDISELKLVEVLFPNYYQEISWLFRTEPSTIGFRQRCEVKTATLTLKGASVKGVRSVFKSKVIEAIECSEQRAWEIRQGSLEETDGLTMDITVACGKPHLATICLRMGYNAASSLVNLIY